MSLPRSNGRQCLWCDIEPVMWLVCCQPLAPVAALCAGLALYVAALNAKTGSRCASCVPPRGRVFNA